MVKLKPVEKQPISFPEKKNTHHIVMYPLNEDLVILNYIINHLRAFIGSRDDLDDIFTIYPYHISLDEPIFHHKPLANSIESLNRFISQQKKIRGVYPLKSVCEVFEDESNRNMVGYKNQELIVFCRYSDEGSFELCENLASQLQLKLLNVQRLCIITSDLSFYKRIFQERCGIQFTNTIKCVYWNFSTTPEHTLTLGFRDLFEWFPETLVNPKEQLLKEKKRSRTLLALHSRFEGDRSEKVNQEREIENLTKKFTIKFKICDNHRNNQPCRFQSMRNGCKFAHGKPDCRSWVFTGHCRFRNCTLNRLHRPEIRGLFRNFQISRDQVLRTMTQQGRKKTTSNLPMMFSQLEKDIRKAMKVQEERIRELKDHYPPPEEEEEVEGENNKNTVRKMSRKKVLNLEIQRQQQRKRQVNQKNNVSMAHQNQHNQPPMNGNVRIMKRNDDIYL